MVNQMNKITASFSGYKAIAFVSVIMLGLVAIGGIYMYMIQMNELSSTVYVINRGEALDATRQDQSITREDEVRDHVSRFHEFFFNIPPSNEMIKRNLTKALEMTTGNSVYNYYNDLQESGYYNRLIKNNAYQQIEVESISIDMEAYPYQVILKGFQYVTRESNISKFSLVTRCKVINSVRSKNNLHGLMIENFEVIENKLIETRNR